jgi:hypothetical protein
LNSFSEVALFCSFWIIVVFNEILCLCLFYAGLSGSLLDKFRRKFQQDAKNQLAQIFCVKHDLYEALRSPKAQTTAHVFNHKVCIVQSLLLHLGDIVPFTE